MEYKGTKGSFEVTGEKYFSVDCRSICKQGETTPVSSIASINSIFRDTNEAKTTAELFADAGNIATKTGLLPSTILKQRDEAVKMLKKIQMSYERYGHLLNFNLGEVAPLIKSITESK